MDKIDKLIEKVDAIKNQLDLQESTIHILADYAREASEIGCGFYHQYGCSENVEGEVASNMNWSGIVLANVIKEWAQMKREGREAPNEGPVNMRLPKIENPPAPPEPK